MLTMDETMNLDQSCRICFVKADILSEIKDVKSSGGSLEDVFYSLLGNEYLIGDFPKLICTPCIQETEATYEFIQKCKASFEYISVHLNSTQILHTSQDAIQSGQSSVNIKTEPVFSTVINLDDEIEEIGSYSDIIDCKKLDSISDEIGVNIQRELLSINEGKDPDVGELESYLISSSDECDKLGTHAAILKNVPRKRSKHGSSPKPQDADKTYKYSCEICYQSYKWPVSLKEHMRIHTKEKPFKCELCGNDYMWRSCLVYHMATHTGDRPYACHMCEKSFIQRNRLRNHLRTHSTKRFNCMICVKGFGTLSGYNHHNRLMHQDASVQNEPV